MTPEEYDVWMGAPWDIAATAAWWIPKDRCARCRQRRPGSGGM